MYQCIFKLSGLVALTSALALSNLPPPVHQKRGDALDDFPDIEAIMSVDPSTFKSYPASAMPHGNNSLGDSSNNTTVPTAERWTCNAQAEFTWGDDPAVDGPGIFITNADMSSQHDGGYRSFYMYHNLCDAVPYKYIWVRARETRFVSLAPRFEGRVTRGVDAWNLAGAPQTLASWLELTVDEGGWAWTDLSLIRGCDGGAVVWATDGSRAWKGFAHPVLEGAPAEAYARKDDGAWILRESTNWDGTINEAVRDWELLQVGADHAFVDDYHGWPIITSTNGRLGTFWPAGRP